MVKLWGREPARAPTGSAHVWQCLGVLLLHSPGPHSSAQPVPETPWGCWEVGAHQRWCRELGLSQMPSLCHAFPRGHFQSCALYNSQTLTAWSAWLSCRYRVGMDSFLQSLSLLFPETVGCVLTTARSIRRDYS